MGTGFIKTTCIYIRVFVSILQLRKLESPQTHMSGTKQQKKRSHDVTEINS